MATVVAPRSRDQLDRVVAYREARDRSIAWLLRQLRPDGSLGDPASGFSYYRAPWTFAVVGETEAALATSAWIRHNLLTPEGRIDGKYRVFDEWASYRDATLVVGTALTLQYDIAVPVWRSLVSIRDPRSGLIPNDRLPGRPPTAEGFSPLLDTSAAGPGCGFAALATGDLATARDIASFLARLWDVQPDLPDRFHFVWSRDRQSIVTSTDPEFTAPIMLLDNTLDAPQFWFLGGICAAFLVRLWMAEPRPEYLALARRYQDFAIAATDAQFNYPAACKGSWGSSLLWQVTGEPRYLDFTHRMAEWYLARQEPEGWWHPLDENTLGDVIEVTLEFAMHLDTLIGALSSRQAVEV